MQYIALQHDKFPAWLRVCAGKIARFALVGHARVLLKTPWECDCALRIVSNFPQRFDGNLQITHQPVH
jgi:hypothetical protein